MDVHLRRLAAEQADIVAAWQLVAAGWSRGMVEHRARRGGWRLVHPGVYVLTHAPLTRRQRLMAATLTSRRSFGSHASAGRHWGFHRFDGPYETITRPGNGGPRRQGALVIRRSRTLGGNTVVRHGVKVTTAARTLVDLAAQLNEIATRKAFREALRLRVMTAHELRAVLERHSRRRGTHLLGKLESRYSTLPYGRCRSDAECRGLEVLHDAELELPKVNIRIAGEEADFVWPDRKLIVEIDGPQFHRFPDEDLRKQGRWEAAGFSVRRVPSGHVFHRPEVLLSAAKRP